MIRSHRLLAALLIGVALAGGLSVPRPAVAASAAELNRDSAAALQRLYQLQPAARKLGQTAKAVLVFPRIVKAGFMFGGQIGEGAMRTGNLLKGGRVVGYYNSVAASYGFQAGIQEFGYALFFMNDAALASLDSRDGFELGVGPSVVLVDQGIGKSITSSTLTEDIYAFIFSQKGLMAGMGVQGSKISKIDK